MQEENGTLLLPTPEGKASKGEQTPGATAQRFRFTRSVPGTHATLKRLPRYPDLIGHLRLDNPGDNQFKQFELIDSEQASPLQPFLKRKDYQINIPAAPAKSSLVLNQGTMTNDDITRYDFPYEQDYSLPKSQVKMQDRQFQQQTLSLPRLSLDSLNSAMSIPRTNI